MTDEDRRLRNTLRVHRARIGITQAELAERVGVSRKTVNTIETGRFMPSTWLALKLGQVLGARVEELFQLDEQPQEAVDPAALPWYLQSPT